MKRFFALALAFGLLAPIGLIGCGDANKTTTETTQSTPEGTTTESVTTETKTTGDAPPVPTGVSGEPAPAPAPAP
ncbi:MAG: hypothetical protein ABI353_11165 [Isosphaeraceae bacterium]